MSRNHPPDKSDNVSDKRQVIFLLNPISGEGHLDAYARLYSAAILKLGYQVVLLADNDAQCATWLEDNNVSADYFSTVGPAPATQLGSAAGNVAIVDKIVRIYSHEGIRGLSKRVLNSAIFRLSHLFIRIKRRAGRLLDKFPALKARVSSILRFNLKNRTYAIPILSVLERIRWAETKTGIKPDLVFILYVDMLDQRPSAWSDFPYPWACIRFSPRIGPWAPDDPVDGFFTVASFSGACLLDERCTSLYQHVLPQIPFVTIPDVCDASVITNGFRRVDNLRKLSAGRTVVFAGGGLTGRKGIGDLARVIACADPTRFFFVIVGKIYWTTFTPPDAAAFRGLIDTPPENCMIHTEFLKDEREFNALIHASDIIYAVYRDFFYSSNMLSKAAHFERPLLVSDRHLMGQRVKVYGLGLTVDEGDIAGITHKLNELRHFNVIDGALAYRRDHSLNALVQVLDSFLSSITSVGALTTNRGVLH